MDSGILLLCFSAAAVALMHTLLGPDHYLPFIVMARARGWSAGRTTLVTLACGGGHVASSLGLGLAASLLGIELQRIARIESVRGSVAAWALIAFGAVYLAWGIRRAGRRHARAHGHPHFNHTPDAHTDPSVAAHESGHDAPAVSTRSITPWVLFAIFVFGPCEPMIPLVMVPAAAGDWEGLGLVTLVFGTVTLATMLAAVLLGRAGVQRIRLGWAERYTHALAGLTLLLTGGAMEVFGL